MSVSPIEGASIAPGEHWQLRLYIAGMTPVARRAISNVEALCEARLAGRYTLTVVDLLQEPARAEEAQIVAVPTLVREAPPPERRVVGDLSEPARAASGLGL
ncbi:MAG: circadian clock KaiB family protein [Myxococcales bacterium]|jgi:circadian clock protein KaiB